MQLRSGTKLNNAIENTPKIMGELTDNQIFELNMKHRLADQLNYPVSVGINNLIYTLNLYDMLYISLNDYDKEDNDSYDRFVITLFEKTLQLMSKLIEKTYKHASIQYTDHTKALIVNTLYKMREVFLIVRYKLSCKEHESDYISELLDISIYEKGEKIFDKKSIEARVYYCYRHFYQSEESNNYDISSYADGTYSEVDIYDYYFKGNVEKDVNNDLLINEDYKKWFVCEETTDRYDNWAYNNYESGEPAHAPLTMYELQHRIQFHKNELDKYERIMQQSH
jgi:hypothetical protein